MTYPQTALTTPHRYPERATYDRSDAHQMLDEAYVCHLGFVVDGAPRILPTLFVRVGETVYLHGSTAATPLLAARGPAGLPVTVAVTVVDGLVLARSQFHHSANYRSLVAHGTARLVTDVATKRAAMEALVDKVGLVLAARPAPALDTLAGGPAVTAPAGASRDGAEWRRSTHTRPPTAAELAKTAVLALDLEQVSVKRRTAGVGDDEADLALPYWAGVVPVCASYGLGQPADGVSVAPPPYVPAPSPWQVAVPLAGSHVTMSAMAPSDAGELFAALDDAQVWEHIISPRPRSVAEMAALVDAAIADPNRVPWTQRDAATGEVVGTTSYYGVNEATRTVAIGWTKVARPRWRTPVNTETKLLLLGHAFDTLGAGRVEFHTDIRNTRSQRALDGIGATREGVARRHKRRADGSWRDTVTYAVTVDDWESVRNRLVSRLAAGHTGAHAGRR